MFANYDATGLKGLIDQREITQEEVVEHYIGQIEKLNPKINAFVHTMFEEARAQTGENATQTGPLRGLPFAVKDLNPVKGHPYTNGSKLQQNYVAEADDLIVERFRKAGLVFLGKTNTPEFGFLPTTEPELFGPTLNPWNHAFSPGGSSGGAAAAVVAGMVPFAHASDGGGSIRIPASCTGLFGLKPSRGLLPYSPYVNQIATSHAVTKSVRDSATLLDALKGKGPYELYPSVSGEESYVDAINRPFYKLKIATTIDWNGQAYVDSETKKAHAKTVAMLEKLGHEVEEVKVDFNLDEFAKSFIDVWMGSGSVVIKHLAQMMQVKPSSENLEKLSEMVLRRGEEMSAQQYEEARVKLYFASQKLIALHEQYDLLLSPVLNKLPLKTGEANHTSEDAFYRNFIDYCSFTPLTNISGQPSMSVPVHWSENGLPVGMQFTGPLGSESLLFQLAGQIEQAYPWWDQYKILYRN
ncbi:amidase [Halalkalibacillus halophilus]|uniref:amidase n=1 Tax=Halalkalibacillus halophilus TaxID=392827 RepID=UPI00041E24C9|nr:amidase [Halalkalibacillus halophilus]